MTGSTISSKSKFKWDLGKVWSAVLTSIWKASAALLVACCLQLNWEMLHLEAAITSSTLLCSTLIEQCIAMVSFHFFKADQSPCNASFHTPIQTSRQRCIASYFAECTRTYSTIFRAGNLDVWGGQHYVSNLSFVQLCGTIAAFGRSFSMSKMANGWQKITPTVYETSTYVPYVYLDWLFSVTIALNEMKRMHILKNCFPNLHVSGSDRVLRTDELK